MKLIEWNIRGAAAFPCNNGYEIPKWVVDEVTNQEADCVVLTEFVVAKGWDYLQEQLERNEYNWFVSAFTGTNGILIALKKNEKYDFNEVFTYKDMEHTFKSSQIFGVTEVPDFAEVRFIVGKEDVSIIGVRIKKDIKKEDPHYTIRQFICLDDYLSSLKHKVICVGDFNAYWAGNWKKEENYTLPKTAKSYDIYTPPYRGCEDWFSYVKSDGSKEIKMQLDHLITNCKAENSSYDWSFIKKSNGYVAVDKFSHNKPVGLPDHAIFRVNIDI